MTAAETIAKLLVAIRDVDGTSWTIADHVAAVPELDDAGQKLTLRQIADTIQAEVGVEWSVTTLGQYRATARAFPVDTRVSMHPFRVHVELRAHPDKLLGWKPKRAGDVLTVERAKQLRGPRSATKRATSDAARIAHVLGGLSVIVEDHPGAVIDALEQLLAQLHRRFDGLIAKEKRRGLAAV